MAAARLLAAALLAIITAQSAAAQSPTITVTGPSSSRTFTQKALLANPVMETADWELRAEAEPEEGEIA